MTISRAGGLPLLHAVTSWECPNCLTTEQTPALPPGSSRYHPCPGLHGLNAPLVPAGTRCKVEAEERQDYIGSEVQARGNDGRQYMAVRTTSGDHDDLLVFAGLAQVTSR